MRTEEAKTILRFVDHNSDQLSRIFLLLQDEIRYRYSAFTGIGENPRHTGSRVPIIPGLLEPFIYKFT